VTAVLRRLRAEVSSDREALEAQLRELDSLGLEAEPFDRGEVARAALALDRCYSAVEAILARVARVVEGGVPEGPDWHQALLSVMALALPGLRPPLLSSESVRGLRQLLSFRHFLRHAYATPLEGARLAGLRADLRLLVPVLDRDLDALESWLEALDDASEG